jgi:hypothetical protein
MESMNEQHQYNDWLVEFYRNLLEDHNRVNDALDDASYAVGYSNGWLDNYNRLSQGWNYTWWGGGGIPYGTYHGKMSVYGDGGIGLW